MDEAVSKALETDLVIDIITTGKKTGTPRIKEIWFHNIEGGIYITGTPGTRDWYANMVANPDFTLHLKDSIEADLSARATPVTDKAQRREVFQRIFQNIEKKTGRGSGRNLDEWVGKSPLVQVELLDT